MTYKVINIFRDNDGKKEEDGTLYKVDDIFKGEMDEARLETLSTENNKYKKPFIVKVETEDEKPENAPDEFPKDTGGGWFLLSNGEKAQGKKAAIEAEKALEK